MTRRLVPCYLIVALTAWFLVGAVPKADAATQDFGAIAYSASTGVAASTVGYSKAEAVAGAETACSGQGGGVDCQAVAWFRNAYGAFATGTPIGNKAGWGWGWASDPAQADTNALSFCGKYAANCRVVKTERTAATAASNLAAAGDMAPLRGNWYVGGFAPGVGDHLNQDRQAVDLFSNQGAVYPVKPGRIVWAAADCRVRGNPPDKGTAAHPCYGNTVVIDHGNGLSSLYTHLRDGSLPPVNTQVGVDDQIGVMGESGCIGCGVHLHFSMRSGPLTGDILFGSGLRPVQTPWTLRRGA